MPSTALNSSSNPGQGSVIVRAPDDESNIQACRKTDCGLKQATVHLGRTLPSLLDEGCELQISAPPSLFSRIPGLRRLFPIPPLSPAALSHYRGGQWHSWTLPEVRRAAEDIALALKDYGGIAQGDRAGLLMDSNVFFVMADIGALLAQLVTVPLWPDQPVATTMQMLQETAPSVLFVSGLKPLKALLPSLPELPSLRLIVVAQLANSSSQNSEAAGPEADSAPLASLAASIPPSIQLLSLEGLRTRAAWSAAAAQALRSPIRPQDLATIVYTLHSSGRPLGAMITHENLSSSVLAAFGTLPCLRKGPDEVALSFLPLHHIFARGFVYGSLSYGQSLYFSSPRLVMKHLKSLRPNVFFTVPRLLEKVYEGWQAALQETVVPNKTIPSAARSSKNALSLSAWLDRLVHRPLYALLNPLASYLRRQALWWGWHLARRYRLDHPGTPSYRIQLWLARQSVFRPLRALFGGRLECFISGGAALAPAVMTLLSAAGLKLCQGYGLTEASSTLSFTRRQWSRAGTVGVPMPGVEMRLAADGEVLVRAPYVMRGYYQAPDVTRAVLEPDGWLHTGDRGEFSEDGLLTLTGYKKDLFKLSIGEYVAPKPIEQTLRQSPLVRQALVVGPGRKFSGVLIFPEMSALQRYCQLESPESCQQNPDYTCLNHPHLLAIYQGLIDQANGSLPFWSTVKRFRLVDAPLTVENGLILPSGEPNRAALCKAFAEEIDRLYQVPAPDSAPEQLPAQSVSETAISLEGSAIASEAASPRGNPLTKAWALWWPRLRGRVQAS